MKKRKWRWVTLEYPYSLQKDNNYIIIWEGVKKPVLKANMLGNFYWSSTYDCYSICLKEWKSLGLQVPKKNEILKVEFKMKVLKGELK